MFVLSFIWHGQILNDLKLISVSLQTYLMISAVVYVGIGLIITSLTYLGKRIKDSFRYGVVAGAAVGLFIYAIAFVFGISFYAGFDLKVVLFDATWQAVEQGLGGLICGWIYRTMYVREKRMAFKDD